MRNYILSAVVFLFINVVLASPPPILVPAQCNFYKSNGGLKQLLMNKHWAIHKVYGDNHPIPDSVYKDVQYLFNENGHFYMISNAKDIEPKATGFDYLVNEVNSTIQIYSHGATDVIQVFKVECLDDGHLSFYYDTPNKDYPNIMTRAEFRFLVDYTWENQIIQESLNNSNQ